VTIDVRRWRRRSSGTMPEIWDKIEVRGFSCDRNFGDDFAEPAQSPNGRVEPIWTSVDLAIPTAAEREHFCFKFCEAVAMQDAPLLVKERTGFGAHHLAA
jgi:hypothetical protein